jgi:hypothetical protein
MKTVKINVSRIDKSAIYEGKNGKYVDLVLFDNRDGTDQYGNDGFVTQDIGKERREAGEKGPILGNWKDIRPKGQTQEAKDEEPRQDPGDSDIPF